MQKRLGDSSFSRFSLFKIEIQMKKQLNTYLNLTDVEEYLNGKLEFVEIETEYPNLRVSYIDTNETYLISVKNDLMVIKKSKTVFSKLFSFGLSKKVDDEKLQNLSDLMDQLETETIERRKREEEEDDKQTKEFLAKREKDYETRHQVIQDYIMKVIADPSHSDPELEAMDLNDDFDLKVPHVADIIYAIILEKKLEIKEVMSFIVTGQNESGNLNVIDQELAASLNVIIDICEKTKHLNLDADTARKISLGTFPSMSDYAFVTINPSLSKVAILTAYLLAMIAFCSDS